MITTRMLCPMALGAALAFSASGTGASQTAGTVEYHDPGNRFVFSYPRAYGTTSPGTDNGFGNRVASIRFSVFSPGGLGGEAVLGRGRVSLDVQAAGGLYDDILTGALPQPLLIALQAALPPLTRDNLCEQLGREQHLDPGSPALSTLTAAQRGALLSLDTMGNGAPRVLRCTVDGDTVAFDKEAAALTNGPRRRVYGAVRFLDPPYSAFQLIRAAATVDDTVLRDMRGLVRSWRQAQ